MKLPRTHILQSAEWGEIKTKLGTPAVRAGGVQYTRHSIPFTPYFFGYCPKVDPEKINWAELLKSARENNCAVINFDCPNVLASDPQANNLESTLKAHCLKAARNTFAKSNVILDISKSEDELLKSMHHKTRYNINYALRNGIQIKEGNKDHFDIFMELHRQTAERQKFYIHSRKYYETLFGILSEKGKAKILTAFLNDKPLSSWMFFINEGVLYYTYGGSSTEHQNLFPNNLLCWEGIKLGKSLGCHIFDMWGAAEDVNDKEDPYHGFTRFKLGFGGEHVTYINSYDLVVNRAVYDSFNTANKVRWFLLRLIKR